MRVSVEKIVISSSNKSKVNTYAPTKIKCWWFIQCEKMFEFREVLLSFGEIIFFPAPFILDMGRWNNRHFQLQLLMTSVALVPDILLYFIGNTFRLCMRKFHFLIIFYRHLLCSSYESLDNQTRELVNKIRRKKKRKKKCQAI